MVDVIEDIKENVEEGGEAIEEIVEKGEEIAEKELKKAKRKGKEELREIEEKVKKGAKEISVKGKAVVEKIGEGLEKDIKRVKKDVRKIEAVFKEDVKDVKELPREEEKNRLSVADLEKKGKSIFKKVGEGIKEGVEKAEESIEEKAEEVEKAVKKDVRKIKKFVGEEVQKIKGKEKTRITISIEKEAESESSEEKISELEGKKKALLEKAKKLKEKISAGEISTEELKEKIKAKKRTDMLVPLEEYVKAGIYLGTRVVTPNMRPFVYRRRADGLAIFNTDTIDEKLKEGVEYLGKFAPEDVILVCKRQAGWRAAEKFSELTGIRAFTKKYPAGILTNKQLPDFFENELTIITDQWVDKNALNDTLKVHKKVLMICDTNNFSQGSDQIIIGNNKSPKSLGIIFYILTRGYCKARGLNTGKIPDLEWWTGEIEETGIGKSRATPEPAEFGV
ncbi:MAG TPA: hypothetical protein VJ142_02650 [Candidatus Nanoarchaeia archaeon]|nr:hypothetical protein [Candidatus Nanoarchaeia archaeon]